MNVQLRQRRSERQVCDGTDVLAMMSLDGVQVWHSGLILDDFHVLEFELLSGIDMIVLEDISSVLAKDGLEGRQIESSTNGFANGQERNSECGVTIILFRRLIMPSTC